jgi:NADH-quinone oxidoreductase subunit N
MTATGLIAILPLLVIGFTAIVVMLAIAFYRSHLLTAGLTALGLCASFGVLFAAAPVTPRNVTELLIIDGSALFYMGLIFAASLAVTFLCYGYYKHQADVRPEEMYVLIVLAALGSCVLVSANHFVSFFLGLEVLSVSLYGMIAYSRRKTGVEAGLKYLVLAATSAAFLLFGMAIIYFQQGSLSFDGIANALTAHAFDTVIVVSGAVLIVVGIGFKLALVPFHMWTPDIYEGAPAPVSAFVATVSKGAMFALLLRLLDRPGFRDTASVLLVLSIIAIASMIAGNLLALLQRNVKRILAYSSIAHLGYLVVAFVAGGVFGRSAAAFYLVAYFATMLGAFGVVSVLSKPGRDIGDIEEYTGLIWRRPVLGSVFTLMLLSLASIPVTAGFIGEFYLVAAGASGELWTLVLALVVTSAVGLFYYLRIIVVLFSRGSEAAETPAHRFTSQSYVWTLCALSAAVVFFGCYPGPLLNLIQMVMGGVR